MTSQLQNAIAVIQSLSTDEQNQLLQILPKLIDQSQSIETQNRVFWQGESLEDLIKTQNPPIIEDIKTLAGDYWGEDSIADFLAFLKEQRQLENNPAK